MVPEDEHDDGADDRQHESRGMEGRALGGPGDHAADEAADERAHHPEERGHKNAEVLLARHQEARQRTDDQSHDQRPDDVSEAHGFLPSPQRSILHVYAVYAAP